MHREQSQEDDDGEKTARDHNYLNNERMDGWIFCDFTSFLTLFQSYQDDGRMIMKGCVQWNPVYGWEDAASSGDRTGPLDK